MISSKYRDRLNDKPSNSFSIELTEKIVLD